MRRKKLKCIIGGTMTINFIFNLVTPVMAAKVTDEIMLVENQEVDKSEDADKEKINVKSIHIDKNEVELGEKVLVSCEIDSTQSKITDVNYKYKHGGIEKSLNLVFNEKTTRYEGILEITEEMIGNEIIPIDIEVTDDTKSKRCWNEYNVEKLIIKVIDKSKEIDTIKPQIEEVTIDRSEAKIGEEIKVETKVSDNNQIQEVVIMYHFINGEGKELKLKYNEQTQKYENKILITEDMKKETITFYLIHSIDSFGNLGEEILEEKVIIADENNEIDKEKSVIEEVKLNNTEFLPNEDIKIEAKISDKYRKLKNVYPGFLEIVELKADKTKVKIGETVKITMQFKDGINMGEQDLYYYIKNTTVGDSIAFKYNEKIKKYEANIKIDKNFNGRTLDFSVQIPNEYGEVLSLTSEELNSSITVEKDTNIDFDSEIPNFKSIKVNKKDFKPGEEVVFTVDAEDKSELNVIAITTNWDRIEFLKNQKTGKYEGKFIIPKETEFKKFGVKHLYISDKFENQISFIEPELGIGDLHVVKDGVRDERAPEIKRDTMSKNQVKVGETVKIGIEASDDLSGIDKLIYKYSDSNNQKSIELQYNKENNLYEAKIETGDYVWGDTIRFDYLEISDKAGNRKKIRKLENSKIEVIGKNEEVNKNENIIEKISINKNVLNSYNKIKVSVKLKEEFKEKINRMYVSVLFEADYSGQWRDHTLFLNKDTNEYEGYLPVVDIFNCKGNIRVDALTIIDINGNYKVMSLNERNDLTAKYSREEEGWIKLNDTYSYLERGKVICGTKIIDNKKYVFNEFGELKSIEKAQIGWIEEQGKWYYYKDYEVLSKEWELINGSWYYFNNSGEMQKNWLNLDGKWYYLNESGSMTIGWSLINGSWYYFNNSGEMQKNWLNLDGKWYYLNESGSMTIGWSLINGSWYYFNNSGEMQKNWLNLDGKWYYLNESGSMTIGWSLINGSWYYFNNSGEMQKNWLNLDGKWYYLNESGSMTIGWSLINGSWYYFNDSGEMQKNWLKLNNKWYYLNENGAMHIGWKLIDGEWYYFNLDGSMETNKNIK